MRRKSRKYAKRSHYRFTFFCFSETLVEPDSALNLIDSLPDMTAHSAGSADTITETDDLMDDVPKIESLKTFDGKSEPADETDGGNDTVKPEIDQDCRW